MVKDSKMSLVNMLIVILLKLLIGEVLRVHQHIMELWILAIKLITIHMTG